MGIFLAHTGAIEVDIPTTYCVINLYRKINWLLL